MRKIVSLIVMLTFLLIGMFALALNARLVEAYLGIWTVDDHRTSDFSKVQNAITEITELDLAVPSRFSIDPIRRLTIKSLFEGCLDTGSIDDFRLPYEVTDKWYLHGEVERGDFAYVGDDLVELVVGVDDTRPNSYSELGDLVGSCGGKLVDTILMDSRVTAVAVDIPYGTMSVFASEVQIAGLSRYIEPNMRCKIDFAPNDPYWSNQWGPHVMEADYAWNSTTGDSSVLVAVIDTGVDWNHPDLAVNYVPLGYDWVNNDPDPMDDHGHGTHCAGVIAATLNNGVGIAGLARVQIMAEKGLDQYGSGSVDELAKAIVHAVDQGADVISCSWGGYGRSTVMHEALKYAYNNGVLVVGAAGNDAVSVEHYPAAYDEVVAVAATDEFDNLAGFTNFGSWVEVAAPGVHIYSTVWDDSYEYMSGTSMATPHVSGLAALIWSQFPNMTRDQVRAQLRHTVDDLGDHGFDIYYGYGRVNARSAVEQDQPDHDVLVLNLNELRYVNVGSQMMINTTILNMGVSDESGVTVQLLVNNSVVNSEVVSFLRSGASVLVSFFWTPAVDGVYNLTSYVLPVPSENMTKNNALFAYVPVRIPEVIRVPEDYDTIQSAVNAAMDGDTIFVASGTYYENVLIDKENLTLLGEDQANTIIDGGGYHDILFLAADNVRIDNFTIRNSGGWDPSVYPPFSGIMVYGSNGHTISNTTTLNNCVGICLFQCNSVTLRGNKMRGNMYNFGIEGYHLMDFMHDIDTSNSVNGKPIYYWTNQRVNQFPTDAGYVAAINSSEITVKDLNLTYNYQGVLFAYSTSSLIEDVRVSKNYIGIHLVHSHACIVASNTATGSQMGIQLQDSDSNNIGHNTVTCGYEGFSLYYSSNNTINRNNMSNNSFGLSLEKSSNNMIEHNVVFNNTYGIYLRNSGYNTLRNSNLTCNSYNFGVMGGHLSHFIEDIDTSNTVNKKPIYYLVNQNQKCIPSGAGYVAVVNSTNIAVKNLSLTNNLHGVLFAYTTESLVENVNTSNNMYNIYLYGSSDNTLMSNTITSENKRGIQLINSRNNIIENNMIIDNNIGIGLWLTAINNTIRNNAISNCTIGGVGLYLDYSTENTIRDNIITNGSYGIMVYWSGSNTFTNNSMIGNPCNFGVSGGSLSDFIQDIDALNTVNGKTMYYRVNQHDQTIPSNAGYIAIVNSTNILVEDQSLANNTHGVLFVHTTNSTIKNVNAFENHNGILLWNSNSNTISGNNVTNNDWGGISLYHSDDNTVTSNNATENELTGIEIDESHKNVIDSNTNMENTIGIMVYHSNNNIVNNNTVTGSTRDCLVGISLTESKGNILSGNTVSNNRFWIGSGIYLEWNSNNNTIIQNILENNNYGINLGSHTTGYCNNNTVYHNNFIINGEQVISHDSINSWDNRCEGNYWSDYNGTDLEEDGIGDAPYTIDQNNTDRYPLMNPHWNPCDTNHDLVINMEDVGTACKAFATELGDERWNCHADITGPTPLEPDYKVDMRDIGLIARDFGETYP